MTQKIDISTSTLFRFILIILGFVFLFLIRDILVILFIALIVAAAVDGPVDWMAKRKIKRWLGTLIIYFLILAFLAGFIYLVFPPLAGQIKNLSANLPQYLGNLGPMFETLGHKVNGENSQQLLNNFANQIYGSGASIFSKAINIFGGLFSALIIFIISIYLVVQDKGIKDFLASLTPQEHRAYVVNLAERIQSKLGGWLRGQLILMVIIGFVSFVGLSLLNVKFALVLALIAGFLELIPFIGPIIAAVPAVAIAFTQSPLLALFVLILYVILQKAEGYLIVPLVMKRTVGLNPLVVMISIIIGAQLGGVAGVVVAVPLVATAAVFFGDLFTQKQK